MYGGYLRRHRRRPSSVAVPPRLTSPVGRNGNICCSFRRPVGHIFDITVFFLGGKMELLGLRFGAEVCFFFWFFFGANSL